MFASTFELSKFINHFFRFFMEGPHRTWFNRNTIISLLYEDVEKSVNWPLMKKKTLSWKKLWLTNTHSKIWRTAAVSLQCFKTPSYIVPSLVNTEEEWKAGGRWIHQIAHTSIQLFKVIFCYVTVTSPRFIFVFVFVFF